VVGEVIFPDADAVSGGASAPFGAGLAATAEVPTELLMAGARAHNRWLAELCSTNPARRAGVAIVPIFEVDDAVAEITRARESGLRGGILIPSMWQPHEPYHDAKYDRVWAACADLHMPVHVHSGAADRASYGEHVGIYVAEVRWWSIRPLWFLLWAGVFERFPTLRFVTTECGAFWAPDLLWTSDLVYDREHAAKKLGKQLTSHLMWGNDFPHPEGTWPHTKEWLQTAFNDIPVDETQQMLGGNAAECYHFDTAALRPLADQFGPTPEDLGQDVDSREKWAELAAAGRPWLTGTEALEVPVGT
jgi:predicted TIM-barrel fold metal-dependent hydrolase